MIRSASLMNKARPLTAKNMNAFVNMCKEFINKTLVNETAKVTMENTYYDANNSLFYCNIHDSISNETVQYSFYMNGYDIREADEFNWEAMFDKQVGDWFYLSLKEIGESTLKTI